MRVSRSRIGALVLAACLLVVIALGSTGCSLSELSRIIAARGDATEDLYGLTVKATGIDPLTATDVDRIYAEDLAAADVVVDVFMVATASTEGRTDDAYTYELIVPYLTDDTKAMLEQAQKMKREAGDATWQDLADALADVVKESLTNDGSAAVDVEITNLEPGLYLVMPHGRGITTGCMAISERFEYTFMPTIVAVPGKQADETGYASTDPSSGDWIDRMVVILKSERTLRVGSLKITKSVDEQSGQTDSFVFLIEGERPDGLTYSNTAEVTLVPSDGTSNYTIVTHIPAGTQVSVRELYCSPRYDGTDAVATATIVSDYEVEIGAGEMASVSFNNQRNGSNNQGYGLENEFTWHSEETDKGSILGWVWDDPQVANRSAKTEK